MQYIRLFTRKKEQRRCRRRASIRNLKMRSEKGARERERERERDEGPGWEEKDKENASRLRHRRLRNANRCPSRFISGCVLPRATRSPFLFFFFFFFFFFFEFPLRLDCAVAIALVLFLEYPIFTRNLILYDEK